MDESGSQKNLDLINALHELALDLRWSWSHATDEIWKKLDPVLWDLTHNPFLILQTISANKINKVLDDGAVRQSIEEFIQNKRQISSSPAWFQQTYPNTVLTSVAFFSMEYMLSEALPIYSGGLGNVAGDFLKSASDLGIPVTGVGLLYQRGYSRQMINNDGSQQTLFPYNDPGQLPLTPLRNAEGEWLRIEVKLPGYSIWLRSWKVQVGRVNLFLLDSNDAANFPIHRSITSELYGSGAELRLMQEMVLGMGGWRLLRALGIKPQVCHLNEGHSAFVVLERALDFMEENDQSFEVALAVTRSGNIFTTHTAVGAGFDSFSPTLIGQYLGRYAKEQLHISLSDLLSLGRQNADNTEEGFNSSYLAIRGSGHINGVSKLHGKVSRQIFGSLFPRWPLDEVPVGYVTNGVHMPTWDSPEADKIWTEAGGKGRWLGAMENLEQNIGMIPGDKLWEFRSAAREAFIIYIRKRHSRQLSISGMPLKAVEDAKHMFDPAVLTLAFARRFVAYKRPNLLLHNGERLRKILTDPHRPVQLVMAGKAHPGDLHGQALIREWIQFINHWELQNHIVFLSDYDMLLTEHLVQGADVWINTPQRPWEACGTSGMKVLVNGGINVSVLDGWWDEAYSPTVGWAIGDRNNFNQYHKDAEDAEQLYDLLEREIVPEFYSRDESGIPLNWISRMRESMARLTPRFSANRSAREYTEQYYLPAANTYLKRASKRGEEGIQLVNWKHNFEKKWKELRFAEVTINSNHSFYHFKVEVYHPDFSADEIRVELFADRVGQKECEKHEMNCKGNTLEKPSISTYEVSVPCGRPLTDYTPRIVPRSSNALIPLECSCILWQR